VREHEIGLAHAREALERRPRAAQGRGEALRELRHPPVRDLRHQGLPAAEMPVQGRRADADEPRRVDEGEAADAALGDEAPRRLDQRLLEVAVVVAPPIRAAPMPHASDVLPVPSS
jgi:hypothetical protein